MTFATPAAAIEAQHAAIADAIALLQDTLDAMPAPDDQTSWLTVAQYAKHAALAQSLVCDLTQE
jgi:hypothetical protein